MADNLAVDVDLFGDENFSLDDPEFTKAVRPSLIFAIAEKPATFPTTSQRQFTADRCPLEQVASRTFRRVEPAAVLQRDRDWRHLDAVIGEVGQETDHVRSGFQRF